MATSAKCYVALIDGKAIGFIAVMHFPHPKAKNIKRIHRLVVLPDYQGLGLGSVLLNSVSKLYKDQKYRVRITTSQPALIYGLKKSDIWKCVNFGRQIHNQTSIYKKNNSGKRITACFEFTPS